MLREHKPSSGRRSFREIVRDALGPIPTLLAAALFLGIAILVSSFLSSWIAELSSRSILLGFGMLFLIALLSTLTAVLLGRRSFSESLEEYLRKIDDGVARLEQGVQTGRQLVELIKRDKRWLIDDSEVYAIESSADLEVAVIAPDLFYEEEDQEYQEIICAHLASQDSAVYKYLLPDLPENAGQARRVLQLFERALNAKGIDDAEAIVRERFQVRGIAVERFPSAALHGVAFYRWRNGDERCLQYLPREFGAFNIDIPLRDTEELKVKLGKTVVARAYQNFLILFEEARPMRTTLPASPVLQGGKRDAEESPTESPDRHEAGEEARKAVAK